MKKITDLFVKVVFGKRIDKLVKAALKEIVLDEYISRELDLSDIGHGELAFRGKHVIKIMAAGFYDLLGEAENYISMDLNAEGYDRMNVIIQRVGEGKMTPHEKAKMWEKKYNDLVG